MVANGYVWRRELPQATELVTASKLEVERITANFVDAAARSRQLPALEHREVVYCAAAELRKKPAAQVSQPVVCADEERRLGPAFSEREFHDKLLRCGAVPFRFVRRLFGYGEGG